jgi:hypothetical protein
MLSYLATIVLNTDLVMDRLHLCIFLSERREQRRMVLVALFLSNTKRQQSYSEQHSHQGIFEIGILHF